MQTIEIPAPLDSFWAFGGWAAVWYVVAALIVRVMMMTNFFDDDSALTENRRKWTLDRAVGFWLVSPVAIPVTFGVLPVVWTLLTVLSVGLVPPPTASRLNYHWVPYEERK